jgi:hypothetical protein
MPPGRKAQSEGCCVVARSLQVAVRDPRSSRHPAQTIGWQGSKRNLDEQGATNEKHARGSPGFSRIRGAGARDV